MYRKFRDDPSSVDPSWHEFLVDYSPEPTGNGQQTAPSDTQTAPPKPAATTAAPAAPPVQQPDDEAKRRPRKCRR